MAKLTEAEILAIVGQELTSAAGAQGQFTEQERQTALNYYLGYKRGDEVIGRSQVQSLDVADNVNAIMSQITPMINGVMVEFEPDSEQDEDQAQLESDFCGWIAGQSNAYEQLASASFDALLQANGFIKVFVETDVQTWTTKHSDLTEVSIIDAITPKDANERAEIVTKSEQDGLYSITVQHTIEEKRLKVESIAPEYILYSTMHLSNNLEGIRFIAEQKQELTRSELLEMGYPKAKVDALPNFTYTSNEAAAVRQGDYGKTGGEQPATQTINVYECYMQLDLEQNGKARLYRIDVAGSEARTLLDYREARFIPFATGSSIPMPHRVKGISQFQLLQPIQDSKTVVLRQWLDNQNAANNSRTGALEGYVNMQDLVESKPGGIVRMKAPDAIFPIPFNDVGMSCQASLQYLDQVRTERGGAALEFQSGQMQIAGSSATAAAAEFGHKEKTSAWYCRNIVQSLVRNSFLLIHQALRTYYDESMQAKLHGKWQTTNPADWKSRRNVRVIGGMSSAERMQKSAALAQNLSYQTTAMQAGLDGVMVTPEKIHATLADWLRSVDLPEVEEYYIDPASPEAKQAADAKAQAAQEQQAQMEQLQQKLIDQEQMLKRYMHDTQLDFDRWEALLKAEIEEMKTVADGVNKLQVEAVKSMTAEKDTETEMES